MKIAILDSITFGDTDLSGFKRFGEVRVYERTLPEETLSRIKDVDIAVTNKVIIDKKLMEQADNLKLVCVAATGMNNVDLEAAKALGIAVKNVAGYSTASVVQHTFSMLFYLLEHSAYYDKRVKSGAYSKSGVFTDVSRPFWEIKAKRWGVIGLGTIGKEVARVARSFGSEAVYYSTSGAHDDSEFKRMALKELLETSDIVSIHAPLNEKTQNLLGYEELSWVKEKAVVLNLGRGGIVDEAAVARIVDEKEIYVGLDVFEKEPLPADSPLFQVKNKERLHLTPHIAWTSEEAREKLITGVIHNIESFLR